MHPVPPGIYQFKNINGTDSYIGSTKDLFYRCFNQHKNHAFTNTNRHRLFYKSVLKKGWSSFNLKILSVTPNYSHLFAEQNPEYTLTEKDLLILRYLTSYELTIAEQLYLDSYKPTLNGSLLANWSTYNVGSSGYVRSDELNDELSLSFLNRKFTKETRSLHRINKTGKKLSETIKAKILKGQGGIAIDLVSFNSKNEGTLCAEAVIKFKTNTLLAKELKISLRTVNRWLDDNKIHSTLSLKYPRVKLVMPTSVESVSAENYLQWLNTEK